MTTAYEDIKPTEGDNVNSFEWIYDINTGTVQTPIWSNIPDVTGLNPNATPKMKEDTTYGNKGNTSQTKVGEDFALDCQIKPVTDELGAVQPALELLLDKADAKGDANVVGYRYYSARIKSLAYQGTAAVNWNRANTGNDDTEFFAFSLTGKGDRKKILNPEFVTTP